MAPSIVRGLRRRRLLAALLLLAALTLLLAGCGGGGTGGETPQGPKLAQSYEDPQGRFSFRYPEGWGINADDPNSLAVELADPDDPNRRDAWFLLDVVELESPMTPAEYIGELKTALEDQQVAGLTWVKEGEATLGGQKAYFVLLTFQPEDQDVPRKIQIYAAASGQAENRIYDIWIAGATEELFDTHLAHLEAILDSLELK